MEQKGTITSRDTWIQKQKEIKICGGMKNKCKHRKQINIH
jgi:hypothetical protein